MWSMGRDASWRRCIGWLLICTRSMANGLTGWSDTACAMGGWRPFTSGRLGCSQKPRRRAPSIGTKISSIGRGALGRWPAAAYRDVERTQAGVVQGALFLLAVLIPFAHFAERLAFGFADLRRQVFGYFALFLVGFVALRYVHPAFELSISPAIILLGFVILALGILVTFLGMSRLNRELQALGARRGQIAVQRSGAVLTSVAVGLAHLRRRPVAHGADLRDAGAVDLFRAVLHVDPRCAAHELDSNWRGRGVRGCIGADAGLAGYGDGGL